MFENHPQPLLILGGEREKFPTFLRRGLRGGYKFISKILLPRISEAPASGYRKTMVCCRVWCPHQTLIKPILKTTIKIVG
jgi:hypothetical protein